MTNTLQIGTPVISPHASGYVSRVTPVDNPDRVFTLAGGMRPVTSDVECVFDGRTSTVPDSIARDWVSRAERANLQPITRDEIEAMRAAALEAQAANLEARRLAMDTERAEREAFKAEAVAKIPPNAKAVIIAELIQDDSDSMSDYWGSKTLRSVILGFSTHTRDLFSEMRAAALNCVDTADLYAAPESAEHREKYSMGGGFYLKAGGRHSSGWRVCKRRFYGHPLDAIPTGEWCVPALGRPKTRAAEPSLAGGGAYAIEAHTHSKHGFGMWIVVLAARVERGEYDRLLSAAKAGSGWYSRAWQGAPAGFAFKDAAKAEAFALANLTQAPAPSGAPAPIVEKAANGNAVAAKLREMADKMQGEVDDKFRDRQTNTPKRQREAQSARLDGYRLQRTQQAMRALADHYDARTVPAPLRGVMTKAAIFDLARGEITSRGGYYDAGHETGKPAVDSPATRALWALLEPRSESDKAAEELHTKIQALQFANIPGYFPTPGPIVARMLEAAGLPETGRILEPEAGSGAILDQVRAAVPGCELIAFERHASLREVLRLKGYELAGADFLESDPMRAVDRVLMNPPFENGQDVRHVRRAFDHLAPGGRLVAIMSPGPFYKSDRASVEFREWFDRLGGEKTDIASGAFKESGTGVASVLVVIDREADQ